MVLLNSREGKILLTLKIAKYIFVSLNLYTTNPDRLIHVHRLYSTSKSYISPLGDPKI